MMVDATTATYLYVEDDTNSRRVMELIMGTMMQIETYIIFEDSLNFMERLAALERTPDVFLLDIHVMPLNGFEMLKLIRSVPEYDQSPVIALTASVMSEEITALKEAGFDGAIAKPLNVRVFPSLITKILSGEAVWHIS